MYNTVVWWCELGEVKIECASHNSSLFGIFLSKITKIGWKFDEIVTKRNLHSFFWDTVYVWSVEICVSVCLCVISGDLCVYVWSVEICVSVCLCVISGDVSVCLCVISGDLCVYVWSVEMCMCVCVSAQWRSAVDGVGSLHVQCGAESVRSRRLPQDSERRQRRGRENVRSLGERSCKSPCWLPI